MIHYYESVELFIGTGVLVHIICFYCVHLV